MRKYPKYKASGVEWFNEIPVNWNLEKIKFQGRVVSGSTPETSKPEFWEGKIVWATPVDFGADNQKYIYTSSRKITNEGLRNIGGRLIPKGAVVISSRAPIGLVALAGVDLVTNQGCKSVIPKKVIGEFLFYCLKEFSKVLENLGNETVFSELSLSTLKNFFLPIPPLPEQHSIVKFLDYKTNQIDRFIANRQKQIELLKEQKAAIINKAVTKGINPNVKMKDSGVEWIGEIPEHWSVTKLKFVSKIFGRIGFRGYTINDLVEKGEGAITISPSNMKANEMNFESCTYISWFKYEESPEIKIFNDDVLFVKTGSTYGKVSMVENLQEPATINPQILVFKKIKTNPMFFFHQLRSKLIQAHVKTSVIGGTIPTISQEKIGNYYFLLPNKVEQGLIIEHITNETKIIDELITKYQKQIDLMQEYRTALISQAVTGKIDVRDWKPKAKNYKTEEMHIGMAAEKPETYN